MNRQYTDSRQERLFLIAYILWMIDAIVGITMWRKISLFNDFCDYLRKIAYILFVVQFLSKKRYTKKDVAGIFAIIFIVVLAEHSVYNKHIIPAMIMIYLAADVDYRKILKCTLVLQSAFMIVTVLASQMDVIEDVIWMQNAERIRQSLGYDYCGYPAHLLLFMTLIWFCVRDRLHMSDAVVWLGLNMLVYWLTDSRADFYLSVIAILGFFIISRFKRYREYKPIRFLMKYGCGLLVVFSVLAQMIYNPANELLQAANDALSSRLSLGHQGIQSYGLSLFGKAVRWIGQGSKQANPDLVYNYVDCAFLKEIISFGIVFIIILIIAFYAAGKEMASKREYALGWAVFVSLLYGVVNAHLCMVTFNVFILCLSLLFKEA